MWDLIVSVPDHCLSFYFGKTSNSELFGIENDDLDFFFSLFTIN